MTLVDSSVWIGHLRVESPRLVALLETEGVVCHPFVIGELACGSLAHRETFLALLRQLPRTDSASHDEALHVLNTHRLWGRGLGWVDVHLLASALLSDCGLWTLDRRLHEAAAELGLAE